MEFFLKMEMVIGVCLGLIHAGYVYLHISGATPMESTHRPAPQYLRGVYYAMWTLGLWIVFGAYVVSLWVLGVIIYALTKAVQLSRPVRQLSQP